MKRLKDRTDLLSPIEASAVALLRSVDGYEPALGSKQRVRARLMSHRCRAEVGFFRPAVVVASLLVAAGASAAIGGALVARKYAAPPHPAAGTTTKPPIVSAPALARHVAPVSSNQVAPMVDVPDADTTPSAESVPASGKSERPTGAPPRHSAKPSEEVKLVFDSMRALRRDGQPDRATKQLDEYLRRNPNGALAEEALALSIEAATVRGDPRAKELAVQYLARYPSGRFRRAAERARARFSP